ncbi:carboxyl transferase domain-containing protein [Streptomyces dysideae]|uniref:Acetyl-coenzyme A carboxylase carboxyl transferase subunits beta/alpha n=1 Tax=Streptomyces dysideae TaxID=909626 RepID=A0A101V4T6_9ACTN|nr:carboxyl transferase domain-containing protein [Streptomyces dysideae]KUO22451.1 acetyl-CoA carboxylase carboxyl transferase subunit alpha/beta [Streptomyces dysideae]
MTEHRLSAREALALVTDDFTQLPHPPGESKPNGPLAWPGYDASRARATERTGEEESVVCGTANVEGTRAVLIAFEFGYLGGSLGERTGDRLEAAYTYAREHRLPVVPLVATGGSRMQEGMRALTQLQRVARQSALTRDAGLPQIAVLRDPTTGGGWATLGAGADVILALPGAQVGFAGSRVRPPDADPTAYTAEAQVAAGAADAVVAPEELRETLGWWLRLLTGVSVEEAPVPRRLGAVGPRARGAAESRGPGAAESRAPRAAELSVKGGAVAVPATGGGPAASSADAGPEATSADAGPEATSADAGPEATSADAGPEATSADAGPEATSADGAVESPAADHTQEAPMTAGACGTTPHPPTTTGAPSTTPEPHPTGDAPELPTPATTPPDVPLTGWEAVQRARSPQRPRADAYLDDYFTHRVAISGDRCGGTDDGMLCGFGEHAGRTVAYAAQTGTATRPAGYRTAARLIRLADRLGIPVLTLVDTPGAANDAEAERQGAGAAIADLFGAVASARTPVTTLLIGEGGSGGALALAAPGNTWATPDSYFSVIAPELAAAILKRPAEEVEATADQLRIRPQDLVELGVIRAEGQFSPGSGDRRS